MWVPVRYNFSHPLDGSDYGRLNIAEILYDDGEVHHRYTRYLSEDGSRWIRHGLYLMYHQNGAKASEGNYADGVEQGLWRDYHPNGHLAAEGNYHAGHEVGVWRFWREDGELQSTD